MTSFLPFIFLQIVGAAPMQSIVASSCPSAEFVRHEVMKWTATSHTAVAEQLIAGLCADVDRSKASMLARQKSPGEGAVTKGLEIAIPKYLDSLASETATVKSFETQHAEALGYSAMVYPRTPEVGTIVVTTTPSQALVAIDDGSYSEARKFLASTGAHTVRGRTDGFADCKTEVLVKARETHRVKCDSTPSKGGPGIR